MAFTRVLKLHMLIGFAVGLTSFAAAVSAEPRAGGSSAHRTVVGALSARAIRPTRPGIRYHISSNDGKGGKRVRDKSEFGIKEIIPAEFRDRYTKWKNELLSTDFGRSQWEYYENNRHFLLRIVVDPEQKFGGGTDDYEWGDMGELVGATITLGKHLDRGYPDPVYYPVMNSLAGYHGTYEISGNILASTKIAHEIGHVNFTSKTTGPVFKRQDKLMASYNKIFLSNGYNVRDPRLVALADELGAKPIEIWEDREYWSEANAMRYLVERINKEYFYCFVVSRIRRNISDHAGSYQDRFSPIAVNGPATGCFN